MLSTYVINTNIAKLIYTHIDFMCILSKLDRLLPLKTGVSCSPFFPKKQWVNAKEGTNF